MNKSKVGIILVNYNGYEDTIRCIQSIANITYSNYAVYIVDNGSTNNSVNIIGKFIKQFDGITLISSEENLGFSGGNNIGIRRALCEGAEYVLLLNNDTIVTERFLEPLLESSVENKIATGRIMYWKEKKIIWYAGGKLSQKLGRAWHDDINKEYWEGLLNEQKVTFISGCCILIPKSVLRKIGILEEKYFLYYEDTEYCWRALNAGIELIYNPESVIYHNVSSTTGHNSVLMNYYKVRNRQYLIKDYVQGLNKVHAYLYAACESIVGLLIKKYQFKAVRLGYSDFYKGIMGKKENI